MADGIAFIEVHTEQGELVHRFTITLDDIKAHGPTHLVQPCVDALPVEELARKVWAAIE
jgi:hypothetical protein